MEFDKVVLEGKKYQDLVKLAKEHDVYRRYAPKAELIDRLLDLNNAAPETDENNLLSDVSMPSLNISDDQPTDVSCRSLRSRVDKANESGFVNKSGIVNKRSILCEINQGNTSVAQRRRKTVAFVSPEQQSSSPAKRFVRVSTPARPVRTPAGKITRKSSIATSTPAAKVSLKKTQNQSQLDSLNSTFTIDNEKDISQISEDSPVPLRRDGTFEIITVDNNGKKVAEVVSITVEPPTPLNKSWDKSTRSTRSRASSLISEDETKTPENLSVKELRKIFEPGVVSANKKVTPAGLSHSCSMPSTSPRYKAKSTRSSMLRASFRKSDVKPSANISLPSTARQAFVTKRAKPSGYSKPTTKTLSILKTPKLKSPSVAKEIEMKQQAVSAKKMLEAASGTKSRIPPPRKVPNFNEMHTKMYSKMESLVDAKQKVLDRAQEYGNVAFPRCAVATPKFFSAEKEQKSVKSDRPVAAARPVAARQLRLPEKSKIPGRAVAEVDSAFSVGVLPFSPPSKKQADKPKKKSPFKQFMPLNSVISRLPVLVTQNTKSGNSFTLKAPSQIQRMKEAIVTKAPVTKVQDIKSKNRSLLKNVRTNKRFELQMQHRMKSQA